MESKVLDLALMFVCALLGYGVVLVLARRRFGERGYALTNAFLSFIFAGLIHMALLMLSIFLTVATYKNWASAEYLEDMALFPHWFKGSEIATSDWMAVCFTLLAFAAAHSLVYSGFAVKQRLQELDSESSGAPVLLAGDIAGLVIFGAIYGGMMLYWESPILVLRMAEQLGVALPADIGSIRSIGELTRGSLFLSSIYWLWPVVILFATWGFTRATLTFHAALQQQNTPADETVQVSADDNVQAPVAEQSVVEPPRVSPVESESASEFSAAVAESRARRDEEQQRALDAQRQAAEEQREASNAESHAARARRARAVAPDAPTVAAPDAPAQNNGHSEANAAAMRDMTAEQERLRVKAERSDAENAALRQQTARNPLWQPNRNGATAHDPFGDGAFFNTENTGE